MWVGRQRTLLGGILASRHTAVREAQRHHIQLRLSEEALNYPGPLGPLPTHPEVRLRAYDLATPVNDQQTLVRNVSLWGASPPQAISWLMARISE